MVYNLSSYAHALLARFRAAGGRFEQREFREPAELGRLPEKVVIHCTGYGARALWRDESIIPVRGQLAWLIPQHEFNYGLLYRNVSVTPRSDGIAVQSLTGGDMKGYGEDDFVPRREESEEAVTTLAGLYARFAPPT
jgi:glycine/D-amino acid oxidase-like deaminating enzyme